MAFGPIKVPLISDDDKRPYLALCEEYSKRATEGARYTCAATFLFLGGAIVFLGAGVTMTVPGVNVISRIVLPAMLPASLAVLASIPFIVASVRKGREKKRTELELFRIIIRLCRKEYSYFADPVRVERSFVNLDHVNEKKEQLLRQEFILRNFLCTSLEHPSTAEKKAEKTRVKKLHAKLQARGEWPLGFNKNLASAFLQAFINHEPDFKDDKVTPPLFPKKEGSLEEKAMSKAFLEARVYIAKRDTKQYLRNIK